MHRITSKHSQFATVGGNDFIATFSFMNIAGRQSSTKTPPHEQALGTAPRAEDNAWQTANKETEASVLRP